VKKLNVILLILSFILSGIGSIFLFDAKISNNDSIQTIAPSNKIESEEITEYTYKTYEDYFIDNFNLPAETYTRDETTNVVTIDYTKITRNTTNGQTELSYNGNVFDVVTSDDLSGSGSQTDPYIIKNGKGFRYLLNESLSKLSIQKKYILLENDIYLNDETFDLKGKPFGGDGIIYNYKCTKNFGQYSYINGNDFSIQGFYAVEDEDLVAETSFNRCLFGKSRISEMKNINLKNFYVNGNNYESTRAFCSYIDIAENIIIHEGTIEAEAGYVSGICGGLMVSAKNCVNHANIYTESNEASGLFREIYDNVIIEKCHNYGTIKSSSTGTSRCGGLVRNAGKNYTIKHCNNYGKIIAGGKQNGGLLAWARHGVIINSNNYGNIESLSAGGFVGYLVENKDITF